MKQEIRQVSNGLVSNDIVFPASHMPGFFLATKYFLVTGAADAETELVAFDKALLEAGVGDVNLIKLSSIVPPRCARVDPFTLQPGAMFGVAFAHIASITPGKMIASAVAIAHPKDQARASLVMEHSGYGDVKEIGKIVMEMAEDGMASRGLAVDRVESVGIAHIVQKVGVTFAGVVEI